MGDIIDNNIVISVISSSTNCLAVELPRHSYSRIIYNIWRSGGSKAWVTLCSINNREKEKRSQLLHYEYSLRLQFSLCAECPDIGPPPTEYLIYFREDRRHVSTIAKYSILHAHDVVSPTTPIMHAIIPGNMLETAGLCLYI